MPPFILDIPHDSNVSTTIYKEKIEYCIPYKSEHLDEKLLDLGMFLKNGITSSFTSVNHISPFFIEDIDSSNSLSDDFDVFSKIEFNETKTIRGKIRITKFTPQVIID
ncbi:MAG: hypothetical protein KDE33_28690 [Bacteroidetes bacterium]|nr:hypothetical protein [Bacteroidota bacterium]